MRRSSLTTFLPAFPVFGRFVSTGIALLLWVLIAVPGGAQEMPDPDSPPPVRDYVSCGHFETQADAQAYFDSRVFELPEVLDSDDDGIACEDAFDTVAGNAEAPNQAEPAPAVARLPKTGTGTTGPGSATPWAIAFVLTSGMALTLGHRFRSERDGR